MEQQIDATYLRPGPVAKATAIGIGAVGLGAGILLATWGISLLWHPTSPEVAVRIENPEIRVRQESPFVVKQEKPFTVEQPGPLKIEPPQVAVKVGHPSPSPTSGIGGDGRTSTGDVIKREVTVFSSVKYGAGSVVTGWNYRNGSGGVPFSQYCYYIIGNVDRSSTRIDIASNGVRLPQTSTSLVPNPEEAFEKCQWWQA